MTGAIKELEDRKIGALAVQLQGEIVMPTDADYTETRKVYNAMIDKYPGMIVK